MDTKVLLAAIIGFILGALLVSIAATTFEKERLQKDDHSAAAICDPRYSSTICNANFLSSSQARSFSG